MLCSDSKTALYMYIGFPCRDKLCMHPKSQTLSMYMLCACHVGYSYGHVCRHVCMHVGSLSRITLSLGELALYVSPCIHWDVV